MCFLYRFNSSPRHLLGVFIQTRISQRRSHLLDSLATSRIRLDSVCTAHNIPSLDCGIPRSFTQSLHTLAALPHLRAVFFAPAFVRQERGADASPCLAAPLCAHRLGPRPFRDAPLRDTALPVHARRFAVRGPPPVMCKRNAAVPPSLLLPSPRFCRLFALAEKARRLVFHRFLVPHGRFCALSTACASLF